MTIEELCQGHDVSDVRLPRLVRAIELGANDDTLRALRDAVRVSCEATIVLPPQKYELLSRGKGWARKGSRASAEWGDKVKGGYRVGPGDWIVGGNDGFQRKGQVSWEVRGVKVGPETWTIAS